MNNMNDKSSKSPMPKSKLPQKKPIENPHKFLQDAPQTSKDSIPLSYSQERLWAIGQIEAQKAVYNVPLVYKVKGKVDKKVLEYCIREIIKRHEILRTTFQVEDGNPTQVILDKLEFELQEDNLINIPEKQKKEKTNQIIQKEIIGKFNLEKGPLIRSRLVEINKDEWIWITVIHHIVFDGWSLNIFMREISMVYDAYLRNREPELESLSIQYSDYAIWQRDWLKEEKLEGLIRYWKTKLTDTPSVLELPTDYPRPTTRSYLGKTERFTLSEEMSKQVKALGKEERVTLYIILLTIFKILLYRYTSQENIIVGSPIANRGQQEVENLIGFFVNTLVLNTQLSGEISFRECLAKVKETFLEAFDNQEMPFEKLVKVLNPQRSLSQSPLFQNMFVFQNAGSGNNLKFPNIKVEEFIIDNPVSKFDLTMSLRKNGEKIEGLIQYDSTLFKDKTIKRMTGHFKQLLSAAIANPDTKVSDLSLLTEKERNQVLNKWNDTKRNYPKDKCIHQLFEEQVKRTPNAIAIKFKGQQLTYQELNNRANQLAHYLRKLGKGPEVIIGISMERSIEIIIGLLGILKAGGVYIPLDPDYPPDRLKFMLEDSSSTFLLTQSWLKNDFVEDKGNIIYMDLVLDKVKNASVENLKDRTKPNNLAYIIYTSGSTGKPKGVAIKHKNAVALICWASNIYTAKEVKGVLASTSINFDLSIYELFFTLSKGGTIILVKDAFDLINTPISGKVTLINTVPSIMNELIRLNTQFPKSLKTVNLAGEPLSLNLKQKVLEHTNAEKIYNLYGPTEDSTYSTYSLLDNYDSHNPTIGSPIENTQVYILDSWLNPVPIGVIGELYIGGDGVALEYINRPNLTAEKFILNPFTNNETKLYKTGDKARFLSTGEIQFLGRDDDQIKIRGFRIELDEISTVLKKHNKVQDVIVIVKENNLGDKQIIAYIVNEFAKNVKPIELRKYLEKKIPSYMIPSIFMTMNKFPLTQNGKIDKMALPDPDWENLELEHKYEEPKTYIEKLLVMIWQEVLGIEKIGIHDNFFDLGGHSLSAIRVVSQAKKENIDIPVHKLFETPLIYELSKIAKSSSSIPKNHEPLSGSMLLTPQMKYRLEVEKSYSIENFAILKLFKTNIKVNSSIFKKAIIEILDHHDSLRMRTIKKEDNVEVYINEVEENNIFIEYDLSNIQEERHKEKILNISQKYKNRLSLSDGPQIFFILFRLGNEISDMIMIIAHHIVADMFSIGILMEDLETLYNQISSNVPVNLPQKTTSIVDWAEKLHKYVESPESLQDIAYWLDINLEEISKLPIEYNKDIKEEARKAVCILGPKDTQQLSLLVRENALFDTPDILISALAKVLIDWTKQFQWLIRLTFAGRISKFIDVDLSRTIGWISRSTPIFLDLAMAQTDKDIILAVKEQREYVSRNSISYGAFWMLSNNKEIANRIAAVANSSEIVFNFSGFSSFLPKEKSLYSPSKMKLEFQHNRIEKKGNIYIFANHDHKSSCLEFKWLYNKKFHKPSTIDWISTKYIDHIKSIISTINHTKYSD